MGENEYSIGDKKLLIMPYFRRDDLVISKFDRKKLNSSNLSYDDQKDFDNFLGHGYCAIAYSFDIRGNQDNFRLNLTDFESNLLEGICSVNGLNNEESSEVRELLNLTLNNLINNDLNYQIVSEKMEVKKEKSNIFSFNFFRKYKQSD